MSRYRQTSYVVFSDVSMLDMLVVVEYLICSLVQGSCMVTCFECDNDRSKIDDRSLNSPINRFRFGSRFSALVIIDGHLHLPAGYGWVSMAKHTHLENNGQWYSSESIK